MSTLYLCGVGNAEGIRLAIQVQRATGRWQRIVLLDDDPATHGRTKLGLEVSGPFDRLTLADRDRDEVVNLVTRTTQGRAKAGARIAAFGLRFASLVHPGVDLLGTELDEEVTVYPFASIGAEARVGRSSVVLPGAIVGHGAHIGRGCVIAPHAVINARVRIGDEVYVGSNASILPDLHIGEGATIAGNTLVVSDVPARATAIGVPAAILEPRAAIQAPAHELFVPEAAASVAPSAAHLAQFEEGVAQVVSDVLERVAISHAANFFDLGGTSHKALQVCDALRARYGWSVQLLDLFRHPTIQGLARAVAAGNGGGSAMAGSLPHINAAQQRAAMRRASARG